MREVRRDMLAGRENINCAGCYKEESHGITSFRQNKNLDIEHLNIDVDRLLANTAEDGSLHDFRMQYWDIRFSNICNLKCRQCGPKYSHTWGSDAAALGQTPTQKNYVIHARNEEHVDMDIYGDLSQLKEVYFAGGEVLFHQEHWDLLDRLVELGLQDIRLTYTTNLTKLNFGSKRLEEYLKQFSNVLFIVSVDAVEDLGCYIRSGLNWQELVNNIETVSKYPGVNIKFNCVVTVYNILHLKPMLEFAYKWGNAYSPIDLTLCHHPEDINIRNLPNDIKELAELRLLSSKHYTAQKERIDGIISYMYEQPVSSWAKTIQFTNQLDALRGENVLDVVPEFKQYWK
jgi:sulfatase maturation enzyme AslB (radical SAM superfamily)